MKSLVENPLLKTVLAYFHPAGRPFIVAFALVTLLLALVGEVSFTVGALLTAWCCYFFRDPDRVTPVRAGLIVSPADGKVVAIKTVTPDADLELGGEPCVRISIFLNVMDVHVNRMPADAEIVARRYRAGKFINAAFDKASEDNERNALVLQLTGDHPRAGQTLGVVQIAGLIARRILCDAKQGDRFKAGERYGIIRFGSRADVYLPPGMVPLVAVGQYMIGGETVIADCVSNEAARAGEKH
jgi:phosphatidylserine decarboxylase